MASTSTMTASLLRRRHQLLSATLTKYTSRQNVTQSRHLSALSPVISASSLSSPYTQNNSYIATSTHHRPFPSIQNHHFSAMALEDDDETELANLLPIHHSRKLPPPVCPPSLLHSEVETIFNAPIGSLIVYDRNPNSNELKSVQEEMNDAYYASDAAVQRAEYILRGLNAVVSEGSFVAKSLRVGAMTLEGGDADASGSGGMSSSDAFHAMLDLIDRMEEEGKAYVELRKRVRSQLTEVGDESSSSSSSDDDDDSSDDSDDEDDASIEAFQKFSNSMDERLAKAGLSSPASRADTQPSTADAPNPLEMDQEDFQFGAAPGTTTHMYDLLLDAMACLVHEQYSGTNTSSTDILEIMGEDSPPPPAMAKLILDKALHRHWLDGGDIGFGSAGEDESSFFKMGQGVGTGVGTGAGNLANITPKTNFDVRTCPTPMTFNAVLRVAAEFDPWAHATAMENAEILRGSKSGGGLSVEQQQERLRDMTLDAAFSSYSRMKLCAALTIRSMDSSTKNATSRSSLKKQAKILAPGSNANHKSKFKSITSGRNTATYSYLIRTISSCLPASLSRGNIAFGLYHKACVQEGVMDGLLVKAMRAVGGYEDDDDVAVESGGNLSPPVANGPLFDSFMEKELGNGWKVAMDKGRKLRHDRNYKMRRHVEWDDTY